MVVMGRLESVSGGALPEWALESTSTLWVLVVKPGPASGVAEDPSLALPSGDRTLAVSLASEGTLTVLASAGRPAVSLASEGTGTVSFARKSDGGDAGGVETSGVSSGLGEGSCEALSKLARLGTGVGGVAGGAVGSRADGC